MKPFNVVYKDAIQHGIVLGVSLPPGREPVPEAILCQLHPDEQAYARDLKGFRQPHWVGGRLAAQAALQLLGANSAPILSDPWGAPTCRPDLSISISHKRHMAVALVARKEHGVIGVDLEDLEPARQGIAERILRPVELEAVHALPPERQWTAIVQRFSIKEAVYKALAPRLRRYIDFAEAEVHPHTDGVAEVRLFLQSGPTPARIEARFIWLHRSVLTTVRVGWED